MPIGPLKESKRVNCEDGSLNDGQAKPDSKEPPRESKEPPGSLKRAPQGGSFESGLALEEPPRESKIPTPRKSKEPPSGV